MIYGLLGQWQTGGLNSVVLRSNHDALKAAVRFGGKSHQFPTAHKAAGRKAPGGTFINPAGEVVGITHLPVRKARLDSTSNAPILSMAAWKDTQTARRSHERNAVTGKSNRHSGAYQIARSRNQIRPMLSIWHRDSVRRKPCEAGPSRRHNHGPHGLFALRCSPAVGRWEGEASRKEGAGNVDGSGATGGRLA